MHTVRQALLPWSSPPALGRGTSPGGIPCRLEVNYRVDSAALRASADAQWWRFGRKAGTLRPCGSSGGRGGSQCARRPCRTPCTRRASPGADSPVRRPRGLVPDGRPCHPARAVRVSLPRGSGRAGRRWPCPRRPCGTRRPGRAFRRCGWQRWGLSPVWIVRCTDTCALWLKASPPCGHGKAARPCAWVTRRDFSPSRTPRTPGACGPRGPEQGGRSAWRSACATRRPRGAPPRCGGAGGPPGW